MTTSAAEPRVLDNLTEDEAYLFALLSDPSGLDQAELRRCRGCLRWKSLDAFHFQSKARGRRHARCGTCRNTQIREANARPEARTKRRERYVASAEERKAYSRRWYAEHGIKKAYGLTREQVDLMIEAQDGRCAICASTPDRLHVDHDHVTGRVRGMLCGRCNRALGLMADEPDRLEAAARYLRAQS